eukprot:196445-Ditylum_brightwellii.AAC.1
MIVFVLCNVPTSSGKTTNVFQHKNHQEEFRTECCHAKLIGLKRPFFKVLISSKRKEIDDDSNLLLRQVKAAYDNFVTCAKYHNTSSDGVQALYNKTNFMDLNLVETFIKGITSNFILEMYQKAVYLSNRLVMLYDTYVEFAEILKNDESTDDKELTSDMKDEDKINLNQEIEKRLKRDRANQTSIYS